MGITHFCFGLSYLTAFGMDVWQTVRPSGWGRWVSVAFSIAGVLAHTIFLAFHQPSPASPYGSLLLLAWVFAVLYLYGNLHRKPYPYTLFVLPLVIAFVGLSLAFFHSKNAEVEAWFSGEHFWGKVHGGLILAASVGITLGFVASVMYLIQDYRLKKKKNLFGSVKLLSLERLEMMNRRAINIAFPLLSIGLLLGAMRVGVVDYSASWTELKIVSTVGLWILGLMLLYLRYGAHLPGRRLAWLTIVAFGWLLITLATSHPFAHGGGSR
jgi:ABC-type transport system involved in cytochrome c biogenesis permease subunit